MRITVIIPTYNEAGTIGTLLDEILEVLRVMPRHEWSVLVVDGHSSDRTPHIVREKTANDARIHLVEEPEKRGIAMAYLTGINHAVDVLHTDAFIEFDGDGQHDPHDIPRLVAKLDEGYDYVIGSRYVPGGGVPTNWAWHRKLLSRYGSIYAKVLLRLPIKDVTSGFKLTRAKGIKNRITLKPEGLLSRHYAYKIQLLAEMVRSGARVAEAPITFRPREHDASKSTWRDIFESLKVTGILKIRTLNVKSNVLRRVLQCMRQIMKSFLSVVLKLLSMLVPLKAIAVIYRAICKIPPLRRVVNYFMSIVIPETITLRHGGKLLLNQSDSVVSGCLALNIYENGEVDFFAKTLLSGMTVLDIGANIGLYSVVAAQIVGDAGRVYAFEPDPLNFSYLSKSIELNNFHNATPVNKAVANSRGEVTLYLSEDNFGVHSLNVTDTPRNSIRVEAISIDDFVAENNIHSVDIIKMDIEGAEGLAFSGMSKLLCSQNAPKLFFEFYPHGLKNMGTDPLLMLNTLQKYGYTIYSIENIGAIPVDLQALSKNLDNKTYYTNLFAMKVART